MNGILQITLAVLAGVCLYAAAHHLWVGWRPPRQPVHLLFALLSLFVAVYVLVKLGSYHAQSATEVVEWRRLEVTLAMTVVVALVWFVMAYTGQQQRWPVVLLSLLLSSVIIANLLLPYGAAYVQLPEFRMLVLPWGEQVADLRVPHRGFIFMSAWSIILGAFFYSGWACFRQYRHGDRRRAVRLGAALGVFLLCVLFNQVVNYGLVNFVHTAEFGFIALVLLMSAGLSHELRVGRDALALSEAALRRSEERLRATLDNTPGVAVQWFDREGRVLYWNTASEKLYEIPAGQAVGKTMRELLHSPEQFSEFLALIAAMEKSRSACGPLEIDIHSVSGSAASVLYTMFPIPGTDAGPIFVCMDVDISERKQAEAELRRHREHLEVLVRERTAQLEAANRELEAFSYSVSHDLRAPLRAVDGFARALEEDSGRQLDDAARGYLARIRTASQRMGQLIDDLLQLSRVGRAALHPVAVDLAGLAREVVAELRAASPERQVEVILAPELPARADAQLLRVVLRNLIENAWKYTGKTGQARIEFRQDEIDGERVFLVRDNGAGFDMQYAGKLFGAFQRLHGAEFPGTGIGLATVQRIIHRHAGRVWAEGRVGEGAVFYFTLPADRAETSASR